RPAVDTPAAFKEAAPAPQTGETGSQWKTAQPAEDIARGEWWKIFGDDKLNALEDTAQQANQDLKAAAARLGQARALTRD
ncbi:hypothetical protein ABTA35_20380, partial [Acinetobacter baumannii]